MEKTVMQCPQADKAWQMLVDERKTVVFLDGWDEVPGAPHKQSDMLPPSGAINFRASELTCDYSVVASVVASIAKVPPG